MQALFDTGRRAAFGFFESAGANILGTNPGNKYPTDAARLKNKWFSSSDQLVHMIMGGEVYLGDPSTDLSWTIGRQLGLQIAAHILSPFGIRPIMDALAAIRDRDGIPVSEQVRRALKQWIEAKGVIKPERKRASTRKHS